MPQTKLSRADMDGQNSMDESKSVSEMSQPIMSNMAKNLNSKANRALTKRERTLLKQEQRR